MLGGAKALDRGDTAALVHHGQRQTGIDAPAIDDHRACAALAVVAALLGARQAKMFTQGIEQRRPRIDIE